MLDRMRTGLKPLPSCPPRCSFCRSGGCGWGLQSVRGRLAGMQDVPGCNSQDECGTHSKQERCTYCYSDRYHGQPILRGIFVRALRRGESDPQIIGRRQS